MKAVEIALRARPDSRQGTLVILLALAVALLLVACAPAVAAEKAGGDNPGQTSFDRPGADDDDDDDDNNNRRNGRRVGQQRQPQPSPVPFHFPPGWNFQWTGVIGVEELEGRHLVVRRDCDVWVLIPQSNEVRLKLESLIGMNAVVWGRVNNGPTIFIRPSVLADMAFGPSDPMPQTLVAVPEHKCKKSDPKPRPVNSYITLNQGEAAARGRLIWEQFQPFLQTPSGNILLTLPSAPAAAAEAGVGDAALVPNLEAAAAGNWYISNNKLGLSTRILRGWPARIIVPNTCINAGAAPGEISILMEQGEMTARGTFTQAGGRTYLMTNGGPIFLTLPASMTANEIALLLANPEVVAAGKWSREGAELRMAVRVARRVRTECPPVPPLPFQPLIAGEIASPGTLVWEAGKAWLDTPSGRIALIVPPAAQIPVPFQGAVPPESLTPPATGTATPVFPQVLVVGKWSLVNGQLTITVRYALPWPVPGNLWPWAHLGQALGLQTNLDLDKGDLKRIEESVKDWLKVMEEQWKARVKASELDD